MAAGHIVSSFWNSLWKQQEIIYRAQKPKEILWLMQDLSDQIASKVVSNADISIAALKSGGKSLSDPSLCRLKLKEYLLGEFLDNLDVPGYMSRKCRELFNTHDAYRTHYNPLSGKVVDTAWILQWPQFGRDLLDFLESIIYREQAQYFCTCCK